MFKFLGPGPGPSQGRPLRLASQSLARAYSTSTAGQQGPFETALRQYGDGGDHCIQGLCVGIFGGISSGITSLRRILAQHGAERLIQRMGSSSMKHCQATLLWLARRDLGAVLWSANADLILHRIQHLGGAATRERSRQRHAQQHRFFPAGDPAAARPPGPPQRGGRVTSSTATPTTGVLPSPKRA